MKGYLQRLVHTVTNPAESVHPWTGSVFAAGHQGDLNAVQSEEPAPATAARESPEVMAPAPEKSSQASAPTKASEPGHERNSLKPELETTQVAPVTEPSAYPALSVSERIVLKPLITNAERTAPDNFDAKELEIMPGQGSDTALTAHGRHSLAGADAVIRPGNTRQLRVGASRTTTAQHDARAARNSVAAEQRTDEIQIHISRIEVTAVHPPPAPAPKARDKGISLDAYLKRRDGRAG